MNSTSKFFTSYMHFYFTLSREGCIPLGELVHNRKHMCKASALYIHGEYEQSRVAFAKAVVSHCCLVAIYPEAQDLLPFVFAGASASGASKETRNAMLSEQTHIVKELHNTDIGDEENIVYIRYMRLISSILSPFNTKT